MPRSAPIAGQPKRQRYESRRGSAHSRGYDKAWQRGRERFLQAFPLCRACTLNDKTTAAYCVDHIEPHKGNAVLFNRQDNWQPLCKTHHDTKTRLENGFETHAPVKGRFVVSGQPGAGKTTWLDNHAKEGDITWDMDRAAVEQCMSAAFPRPTAEVETLKIQRAVILSSLMLTNSGGCVLIVTHKGHASRVAKAIGAKQVHLDGGRRDSYG